MAESLPEPKKPWQSKTIVVNAILAFLGAAAMFVPAAAPLAAWISANGAIIATVWGVLNVALRLFTKGAVQLYD